MKKSNQKQLSYAEAQAALNKLIEALQSEQIPLEELPQLYAEALEIEKHCRGVLEQVVQDIKQLDPDGFTISELTNQNYPDG